MLTLSVVTDELWDEKNEIFIEPKVKKIVLEHSLVSISKWEAKFNKVFLSKEKKSPAEILGYIKCMTITQNVDDMVYQHLNHEHMTEVEKYIEDPMCATVFGNNDSNNRSNEQITAELIYYWMIALNIPFECQKWHLNRLLTLIKVCNIKNQPPQKKSRREILSRNAALNAERRKQLNSKG